MKFSRYLDCLDADFDRLRSVAAIDLAAAVPVATWGAHLTSILDSSPARRYVVRTDGARWSLHTAPASSASATVTAG